jgi:hypothetical protein
VDVKAFIRVSVEAPNAAVARKEADALVESCDPTPGFINGWNTVRRVDNPKVRVADAGSFEVDGTSEVEKICNGCGEALDEFVEGEFASGYHPDCEPEPPEPPEDTPSLDTSFHDHEMNV